MLSVVLCVLCIVCVWLKYARARDASAHALPPAYPGALPIIGHTHMLVTDPTNLWTRLKNIAEDSMKQGGVSHLVIGGDIYYVITDPQDALTAINSCMKRHFGFEFGKVLWGDGLITSSEETWKRHRKLLNPAFTLPVIHGFLEVFNSQAKRLVSLVEPHAGQGLFDHWIHLRNITLETLCVTIFGIDPIDDSTFIHTYMESLDKIQDLIVSRVTIFWLQSDIIYKLLGFKKKETELVETLKEMSHKVIQQKKAAIKERATNNVTEYTGVKQRPFLELLLELSTSGALTDKDIQEEMDTFLGAGADTTSLQLTYILLQLGANPEVQEKVHEELLEVLGVDRDVEKDDVNKLVYTNAVIMESLRLLPSIPINPRQVDNDVKLKNYTMRAGSQFVIYSTLSLNQSWHEESIQFRPERWLSDGVYNNNDIAVFGMGKRACIGKTYSMTSMKVTLAHFLRRYRVKADMSKLQLKYHLVLKPVSGYNITIERRT